MNEYFGDPLLRGAIVGAAGSFLRESAVIYRQIEKKKTVRTLIILFLPLWIVCGGILGAIVGVGTGIGKGGISTISLLIMGAEWRWVITDSKNALKKIRDTLNKINLDSDSDDKEEK